jgi:hypothetical protein
VQCQEIGALLFTEHDGSNSKESKETSAMNPRINKTAAKHREGHYLWSNSRAAGKRVSGNAAAEGLSAKLTSELVASGGDAGRQPTSFSLQATATSVPESVNV